MSWRRDTEDVRWPADSRKLKYHSTQQNTSTPEKSRVIFRDHINPNLFKSGPETDQELTLRADLEKIFWKQITAYYFEIEVM